MFDFLISHKIIISILSNVFTALGTVGAVITALWLSYKDSQPRLKVFATVGELLSEKREILCLSCTNIGKQSIVCTGFAFKFIRFNRKKRKLRIMPNPTYEISGLKPSVPPRPLQYGEQIQEYFNDIFFTDENWGEILSKYKWIAKLELKFLCKPIVTTNIKEFSGKLSGDFVKKIINSIFP